MSLAPFYQYRNHKLWLEDCDLSVLAHQYGTPLYVYSENAVKTAVEHYQKALAQAGLKASICYAVKANNNLNLLKKLNEWGVGADVVSGGELYRALAAGIAANRIVFAGVGKTAAEIDYALQEDILALHVESAAELDLIEQRARSGGFGRVGIGLRVRPDVEADTHHYITTGSHDSKFGLGVEEARQLAYRVAANPNLELRGLHVHIGSQILQLDGMLKAARIIIDLAEDLRQHNIQLNYLDFGGGLGVDYTGQGGTLIGPEELARGLAETLGAAKDYYRVLVEPGRYLVAQAGALLTQVLYRKGTDTRFAIVDAGMNDFIRPALYGAEHQIVPLHQQSGSAETLQIVGPVCESADFLGRNVELAGIEAGAYLAILGTGAYGFSMASNYNSRPRPAEVLINGATAQIIRRRESYAEMLSAETY